MTPVHERPFPDPLADKFDEAVQYVLEQLTNDFARLGHHIREHRRHNEKIERARDLLVRIRALADEAGALLDKLDSQTSLVDDLLERANEAGALVKALADENLLHPASSLRPPEPPPTPQPDHLSD